MSIDWKSVTSRSSSHGRFSTGTPGTATSFRPAPTILSLKSNRLASDERTGKIDSRYGKVECVPIQPSTSGASDSGRATGLKTSVSTTVGMTRARAPLLETYSAIDRLPQVTTVAHLIKSSVLLNHFKVLLSGP